MDDNYRGRTYFRKPANAEDEVFLLVKMICINLSGFIIVVFDFEVEFGWNKNGPNYGGRVWHVGGGVYRRL